jgi:transcriptional regulator with XRE-family HTH domain
MNRIKQLREEFNISQSELGKKLNKTQQQISLYEKGINDLDLDGYIILSKLFNCSIEYIAGKSDKRNNDIDYDPDLLQIGLSTKDYDISEEKKQQIEEFAKYVLKDNKKKEND